MAATFDLEVMTPEKKFYAGKVEMVVLRTPEGEIGVLHGHVPMVAAVTPGPIKIKVDGEWLSAAITEGFMEVKQDKTIILIDTAEWPDEIDVNRAKAAKERAEERLHTKLSRVEYIHSQAALTRALARIKVSKHK